MISPARRDQSLAVACVLFLLSGAAGLIYQVAWQRILALTTGVTVHSVAIITAAFLAGLGVGSHLGGKLSARLQPRRALQAFAAVALGVAAFAAASVPLYYGVLLPTVPGPLRRRRAGRAHVPRLALPTHGTSIGRPVAQPTCV